MFQGPFVCEREIGGIEEYDHFSICDATGALIAPCGTSEESAKFIVDLMNRGASVTSLLQVMPLEESEKALKNLDDFLSSKF